ncbi:MAG: transketolase C-terminal domain-containing protein [Bdellovibrionales bacterium]
MNSPLSIPVKLAGNPTQDPQFHLTVPGPQGPLKVADPRATRALVSLMNMHAVIGGAASHFGGPSALAELMAALHALVFAESKAKNKNWFDLYHIINDVGHAENGLYALKANYGMAGLNFEKLRKFRSLESGLAGHGEVHLFPEGVFLSNGPLGSAFPQSQGLAIGERLSGRMRTTFCVLSDGASMEGEAKEAFAAIPGLAQKGKLGPYVLLISDNNTKLSGRIDQDSYGMGPTFQSLQALGWDYRKLENGHDLKACLQTLHQALQDAVARPQTPIVIHAKTIKGYGVKKTAESATGGHGFPLKSASELSAFLQEIYQGESVPEFFVKWAEELVQIEKQKGSAADPGEKIQKGVASGLIKAYEKGLPVVSVTSDLAGSTGVADFRKKFPEATIDVGVAESNMVSAAAGLSKLGYIPVVDTFAQFGVTKGALPLTMAALSEAPLIAIYSHTGFQDAADGASHQALSYVAMSASIPHVKVHALTCSDEAENLILQAIDQMVQARAKGETSDSHIFFLGRENFPKSYGVTGYKLMQPQIVQEKPGKSPVAVVAAGSLMPEALKACAELEKSGRGFILINPSCLNRVPVDFYKQILEKTNGQLLTLEDHQITAGFGQILVATLVASGVKVRARNLGVCGEFGQSAYNAIDLYRKHGLDAAGILRALERL